MTIGDRGCQSRRREPHGPGGTSTCPRASETPSTASLRTRGHLGGARSLPPPGLDAFTGESDRVTVPCYLGAIAGISARLDGSSDRLMSWSDGDRKRDPSHVYLPSYRGLPVVRHRRHSARFRIEPCRSASGSASPSCSVRHSTSPDLAADVHLQSESPVHCIHASDECWRLWSEPVPTAAPPIHAVGAHRGRVRGPRGGAWSIRCRIQTRHRQTRR